MPRFIPEVEFSKGASIKPMNQVSEVYSFFKEIGFRSSALNELFVFDFPEPKMVLYQAHFQLVKDSGQFNTYHSIPFSFDDFILAYVAAEYGWAVISYDHHLTRILRNYLNYEIFWPHQADKLAPDSIALLDTNIIFEYLYGTKRNRWEIQNMFQKSNSIVFLISWNIFQELKRVYQHFHYNELKLREYAEDQLKRAAILKSVEIPEEDDLDLFIDDFLRFESWHSAKKSNRNRKILQKSRKNKFAHMQEGEKWLISPRFQLVFQRIFF